MEDSYNRQRSGIWRCLRDGDFEEDEVWAVFEDRPDYNISGVHKPKEKGSSPLAVPRTLPSAARMIPRTSSGNNSASSSHETKVLQQSAPLNIPDWSQIYRNKPNKDPVSVSKFGDYDDFYYSVGGEGDGDGIVNMVEEGIVMMRKKKIMSMTQSSSHMSLLQEGFSGLKYPYFQFLKALEGPQG
ncbi:hypothetical protein ACSQ67_008840 [Phaseolus vulgaris]